MGDDPKRDPERDLLRDLLPTTGENIDPVEMARRDQRKALPRRFYKNADTREEDGQFTLVLDGRPALTPARNQLAVPDARLAQLLVAEWEAQKEVIDPSAMPLTRLVNSALDGVARDIAAVQAEVVKYAGSDLLCYRAGEPETLAAAQRQAWDPVIAWMRETHGARFVLAEGVMHAAQPEETLAAVHAVVADLTGQGVAAPLKAAALNTVTTLTGSALLALALASGKLAADEAWAAAQVDEDYQMRVWGADAEAVERQARRKIEMDAAAAVLAALA
ncbi:MULTISPECIES: ATP12 family protein [unclassified Beijerinckia]|uniref:ATP12 family chaperone protein n=1 Tax=unclassified Beijerinckia TaxID=2638183 RepID=UPI000895A396|nr:MULTISPECIES: ATP12 family protein [unclassified Beijerinckia]MDH7794459.1 chaperone required for assembly of F1-ATPase [Beijerinckia sp. GAS462]SEB63008.1 Chaperone required for the assembly of the F1-ATPase [Beijerinckia sp. 28-YEA-48]